MGRGSKSSSTIGILASAAATLAAMTAYNVYRARKAEREHPPVGQFVTVGGIRLHYIERGEGPPVVLLHGARSANEKRRGADQGTVIDLPHEEVRDIRTAYRAEPPVLWRGQDAVSTSCGAVFQKTWPHNGPVEP